MKIQSLFSILLGIILLSPSVSIFSETLTQSEDLFTEGRTPTVYQNPDMNWTFTPGDYVIISGAEFGEEIRSEIENDSDFDVATLNWYKDVRFETQADGPCEIQTVIENCHIQTMTLAINITAFNNSDNTKIIMNMSWDSKNSNPIIYSGWNLEESEGYQRIWYGPQDGDPFLVLTDWENETIESNMTGEPAEIIVGDNWTESEHSFIKYEGQTDSWSDPSMSGDGNQSESESDYSEEWTNYSIEAVQEITIDFAGYNEANTSGSGPSSITGLEVKSWIIHDNGSTEVDGVFATTTYGMPIQFEDVNLLTYKYQAEYLGQTDSDADGVMDDADICPNTETEAEVDQNGCSWDQRDDDSDGVSNGEDQCEGYDDTIDSNNNTIPDDCDNKAPNANFTVYGGPAYPGIITDMEPWLSGDEVLPSYQVKMDFFFGIAIVGIDACESYDNDTYNPDNGTGENGISLYTWQVFYDARFDDEMQSEDPNIYQTEDCEWTYTFKNITAEPSGEYVNQIRVELVVSDEFELSSEPAGAIFVIVPDNWHDEDRDGVDDEDDQCPGYDDNIDVDEDGTADGCDSLVDRDNDGVADEDDQCNGYDDSIDVDGDDKPDGCDVLIDSDNDLVADEDDMCDGFDDAVDIDFDNIPDACDSIVDKDSDGVAFADDLCLWTPGSEEADERGCSQSQLDDDNDDVTNDKDQCLDIDAGEIDSNEDGCPDDGDSDGVIDAMDSCINKAAGSIDNDNDGCPDDSDSDGISDENDECPQEKVCKTSDSAESGIFGQSNSRILSGVIGVIILLMVSVIAIKFVKGGDSGGMLQDDTSQLFAQQSAPSPQTQGTMEDGNEILEHPAGSGAFYYREQTTGQWVEWR